MSGELQTIVAARSLIGKRSCFIGVGRPSTAAILARMVHNPELVLVYESGTIGAKPRTIPLSIGDGQLAETADSVVSVPEIFNYWLQAGRVDVGFLGAAQMDRYGNINTTVVGPYGSPKVRLPGAGGAPEIAASAKEVVIILRQKPRAFVEELDFVTSIGHRFGGDSRKELGYSGAGPTVVITDLGILRPDPETRELTLVALHPDATVEEAKEATGWDLKVAEQPEKTDSPTEEELRILRDLKARTEASRKKA